MSFAKQLGTLTAGLVVLAACSASPRPVHLEARGALGPYADAVLAGHFCFVSGKIGKRGGSIEEEADTAIDALEASLARADLTLDDVVQCNVFLTDIVYYSYFNAVYAKRFKAPYPARACVAVEALPGNARVEIQAIAQRP